MKMKICLAQEMFHLLRNPGLAYETKMVFWNTVKMLLKYNCNGISIFEGSVSQNMGHEPLIACKPLFSGLQTGPSHLQVNLSLLRLLQECTNPCLGAKSSPSEDLFICLFVYYLANYLGNLGLNLINQEDGWHFEIYVFSISGEEMASTSCVSVPPFTIGPIQDTDGN